MRAHLRRKLTGQPRDVPSKLSEALTVYCMKSLLKDIRILKMLHERDHELIMHIAIDEIAVTIVQHQNMVAFAHHF